MKAENCRLLNMSQVDNVLPCLPVTSGITGVSVLKVMTAIVIYIGEGCSCG